MQTLILVAAKTLFFGAAVAKLMDSVEKRIVEYRELKNKLESDTYMKTCADPWENDSPIK